MNRAEEIVAKLQEYSDAYYQGHELISDADFDALEDELRSIDPENSWFKKNRESVYGAKYPHPYEFVGSIDKIHSLAESKIHDFVLEVSAKLDGTSMVAYFEEGKLVRALTRGDGYYGMDVTPHYLAITKKYPVRIPAWFTGAIRGEVVFANSNWERFKKKYPDAKAPRNSGTGLVNAKEVNEEDEALLDYVIYDVLAVNRDTLTRRELLGSFGIPTAPSWLVGSADLTEDYLVTVYQQWSEYFPIDGLVLRGICQIYEKDGMYHYTKHQEAFKFQAEIKATTVKDIEWQVGRTGKLTPVLKVEPVFLSGAEVTSITAHNAALVLEKQLGRGAHITAYRSGEVIPRLHEVLVSSDDVHLPTHCPYCGQPLEWSETHKDLYCRNDNCEGLLKFRCFNFLEIMCSDVKGIGEAFEEQLWEAVTDFARVESIANFWGALMELRPEQYSSFTPSAKKLVEEIQSVLCSTEIDVTKLFLSLGIKLLGTEAAKQLGSNPVAITLFTDADSPDFLQTAISTLLPTQVALGKNIMANRELLSDIDFILVQYDKVLHFATKQEVRLYAVTGSLSVPRKQFQQQLAAKGWQMTETMSKAEVLITDDPSSSSSKNKQADKLGVKKMTEADFRSTYKI